MGQKIQCFVRFVHAHLIRDFNGFDIVTDLRGKV